jgi:protein TonB
MASESAAPPIVAVPNAAAAREGSQGAASQPDRAPAAAAPVSSGISTPSYLFAPEPEYPQSAREDGLEGLVVLRVLVSSAGRPAEIRIARTSGSRALDVAAVVGVKRWTFVAAKQGDRSVDAWMDVPIRFHLR